MFTFKNPFKNPFKNAIPPTAIHTEQPVISAPVEKPPSDLEIKINKIKQQIKEKEEYIKNQDEATYNDLVNQLKDVYSRNEKRAIEVANIIDSNIKADSSTINSFKNVNIIHSIGERYKFIKKTKPEIKNEIKELKEELANLEALNISEENKGGKKHKKYKRKITKKRSRKNKRKTVSKK